MSSSLQYRALLVDPGNTTAERPLQIFSTSRSEVEEWVGKVLPSAVSPDAAVILYQTVETQVDIFTKKGKPK